MGGKKHRPGLFHCKDCRGQFTVLTGSVIERSHVQLPKWVLAYHLMAASKKGIPAHQLHRTKRFVSLFQWIESDRRHPRPAPFPPNSSYDFSASGILCTGSGSPTGHRELLEPSLNVVMWEIRRSVQSARRIVRPAIRRNSEEDNSSLIVGSPFLGLFKGGVP